MTILIIILALIAIAIIFGQRAAQTIILGGAGLFIVLLVVVIILVVGGLLISFLDQISINETMQGVIAVVIFSFIFGLIGNIRLFGKKDGVAAESPPSWFSAESSPSWFGGDKQQLAEFCKWNESAFQRIRADELANKKSKISNKLPPWFSGNKQQWNEFQKWIQDQIQSTHTSNSKKDDLGDPSWFGGNQQQWNEFQKWYGAFITKAEDALLDTFLEGLNKKDHDLQDK